MNKKLNTALLASIYFFPWGIQCLAANFIPMYLANLPFVSEKTAGTAIAFGAIVTMFAQLLWGRLADKSKNKKNILFASFVILAVCSGLFLRNVKGMKELYLLIFLFYSCYMVHQPLVDSIAIECADKSTMIFARLRSFASLGYALTGFVYGLLPANNVNNSFIIMVILAVISAAIALVLPKEEHHEREKETKHTDGHLWTPSFTMFIAATFLIFICSSALTVFSPIFYTTVLKGNVGFYSVVLSAGTLIEWGFMVVFGKKLMDIKPKTTFRLMLLAGILQALLMYLARNEILVGASMLFKGIWFGFLWSFATPYLKKAVSANNITMAQSVWTIASSGIATSLGAFLGGYTAEFLGIRNLFLVIAIVLAVLFIITNRFIKEEEL